MCIPGSIDFQSSELSETHYLENSLAIDQQLILYLDKTGNLEDFRCAYDLHLSETGLFHLNHKFYPRFKFTVQIDPEMLFELGGDLGPLFVNEVDHFKNLLNLALRNYMNFLNLEDRSEDLPMSHLEEDLDIWIELMSDYFPDPNFSCHGQLTQSISLQKLTGSLLYLMGPKKFEKSKLFRCESRLCRYQARVRPDKRPPSCVLTGHAMVEEPRATEVGEYWEARFLYHVDRLPITVRIPTAITKSLQWNLGARYNVVFHYDLQLTMYCAWYLVETVPDLKPFLSEQPDSIRNLRLELETQCAQSPWTLVSYMSAELCTSVAPRGMFQNLKMGLLLSLASMRRDTVKPIPLFCLGPEISTLIREAATLAPHCIDMTANPTTQGCVEGSISDGELQAGPLQMARDGICYLGEWSKYDHGKKSPASKVLKSLEDGYISMTNQGTSHLCQLKCSVWTTCHWMPNKKASANYQIASLKVIFENFGMPFILDFATDQEAEEYSSFILGKSLRGAEPWEEFISRDDFKQYLEMVKTIHVEADRSSKELISNYFVAIRRSRPECSLPITAVSKLTVLAESHARLRLSPIVTHEDAIAVIRLYEQSMSYVYGKSICTTMCPSMELDFEKPAQIHDAMISFSLWLDKYIRTYIRGSSMTSRDGSMPFY